MCQEITVAIVQAAAPWFNLQAGIDKAAELTAQAAVKGATFVLFPEAFIGGYPRGLSFGTVIGDRSAAGRELWQTYSSSCPVEGGPEIAALGAIANDNQVYLAVGVCRACSFRRESLLLDPLFLTGRRIDWASSQVETDCRRTFDLVGRFDRRFSGRGGLWICKSRWFNLLGELHAVGKDVIVSTRDRNLFGTHG